ncbi:MAG: HAMP domain-containing histidine kinase [Bdellovibrionaceae bacterium]|nr:HAMP domain-containing histidine kinase [Pseudobdellovibrionaceae bacterium]
MPDIHQDDVREDLLRLTLRLVNSIKRADRMIQELLDASALQIGEKVALKFRDCDMISVIQEVMAELPHKEHARVLLDGVSAKGCWDSEALRRAIENLVTNALKYGDSTSAITIKVRPAHERVMVTVHNYGAHIPVEEQEALFQAFRRSHSAKSSGKPGWGIGLALVRAVAEGHGGSVVVDSRPEKGTAFIIDIPEDARPFLNAPVTGS